MPGVPEVKLHSHHQEFIARFTQACQADERIVAAFLGGSNVKGKADEYSDIDLTVITTDDSYEEFCKQRQSFLETLGEVVFLEDFDIPNLVLFILADGIEGEINSGSESHLDHIHSGPFHVLLDKINILKDAAFPEREPDFSNQVEKLQSNIFVFWHEMSHFVTAMGRGHLWWAQGQVEAMRSICVNLARLQHNFFDDGVGEEPYFKVEYALPVENLVPLEGTFGPLEKKAILQSALGILQFYSQIAPPLAQSHGISYPHKLERLMRDRLKKLLAKK